MFPTRRPLQICVLAVSLAISALARADSSVPQALVSEQGKTEVLFDYFEVVEHKKSPDGHDLKITRTRFVDRETKQDAFREVLTTDPEGRHMISYEVTHLQMDEKGSISVDRAQKKIFYRYFKEKKWKENTEKLEEPFIVGPMIPRFIELHAASWNAGKKERFHLAVPYMAKSFNFALEKDKDKIFEGRPMISLQMSPTNFLVRAAVKPLYFTFDPTGQEVRQIFGKVFLKKRTSDGLSAFMALTHFLKHPAPAPAAVKSP
jgi:hypothetical protein